VRASYLKNRSPTLFRRLTDLQHIPQLPVTEIVASMMEDVVEAVLLTPPFPNAGLSVTQEELMAIMWIVKLNGFSCSTSNQEERYGLKTSTMDVVYVGSSQLNNSCSPNCSYFTNNQPPFRIVIRTAMKVYKGQALTINYFPYGGMPTTDRQKLIRQRYWFTCKISA